MRHDEIERALRAEPLVEPSTGFAASVMAAVRAEATAPPPLAFPWRRALPAMAVAGLCLVATAIAFGSAMASAPAAAPGDTADPASRALAWLAQDHRAAYLAVVACLVLVTGLARAPRRDRGTLL